MPMDIAAPTATTTARAATDAPIIPFVVERPVTATSATDRLRDEAGSLVTEYGLLTILGGTVVALAMKFVSNGALWDLLGAVLTKARGLVGA